MKISTVIIKIRTLLRDREFWKFTGQFLILLLVIYIFHLFSMNIQSPNFTYAEF